MADLSDIDTSTVGVIAYWNALDHGVNSIDPTEATSYSNWNSYGQYDNGLEGTINWGGQDDWNARIKTDGWFVVWTDRTNSYGQDELDPADLGGYYTVAHHALQPASQSALPQSNPSTIIDQLRQELSNSGSMTFTHSDVGHYNYDLPNATTLSVFAAYVSGTGNSQSGDLSYTDQTTIYYNAAVGTANTYNQNYGAFSNFGGHELAGDGGRDDGATLYGARDVKAQGDMTPGSATSWSLDSQASGSEATISLVAWWA